MRRANPRFSLLLLTLCLGVPGWTAPPSEPEAVEAELEALRQRISEIQAGMEALEGERDAVQRRLQDLEEEIGAAVAAVRALDQDMNRQQAALEDLRREFRAEEAELASGRRVLGDHLRAAYRLGRHDTLQLLLRQEDPLAVGRVLGYYRFFSRARVRQIEQVLVRLARLRDLEAAIEARTGELRRLRAERETERERLETSRGLRAALLRDLEQQLAGGAGELERLAADRDRLERLLSALREALTEAEGRLDLPDFATLAGQLDMPVGGELVRRFGEAREGGNTSEGWLIAAERGAPIRAVSAGRVVFADWLRGFGLIIIVDHGDEWMSLYAHADGLYKETGDWVRAGEVLASVGASGGRGESALYFELRRAGAPVDPRNWIRVARR